MKQASLLGAKQVWLPSWSKSTFTFVALVLLVGAAMVGYLVRHRQGALLWINQRLASHSLQTKLPLRYVEVDGETAGDCKMVGDINNDGQPDLVIGGDIHEGLNWYAYPDWARTVIARPTIEFTTDGALGDVDNDGDLDIVIPDGDRGDNVLWYENPLPNTEAESGSQWQRRVIGSVANWVKDVELADFDGNGTLDVATRNDTKVVIFFQLENGAWNPVEFLNFNVGFEGMASGDIDQDGIIDLVLRGVWVHNPGGAAAHTAANWSQHTIGQVDGAFKALVTDLNQDGKTDVLFSSSEWFDSVAWWTPVSADRTGAWQRNEIVHEVERSHTLQAADMDNDGDTDVVIGQMHTSVGTEIAIMVNADGQATRWERQLVAIGGLHNGVVADIGNDGDYDIFGANWTGNPPVKLWENELNPSSSEKAGETLALNRWTYKEITSNQAQTFGLAFGNIDGDKEEDIVAGPYWYRNPGGDLLGDWSQHALPAGMHGLLVVDVDKDEFADVIAQKDEGDLALYWLEAKDADADTWQSTLVGHVPAASHTLGAQGYHSGNLFGDASPEIVIASGNGIYYFVIPENPAEEQWPRVLIAHGPSDEGFDLGDVDRDGDLDLAATTGEAKGVAWYENPGDGLATWETHAIGRMPAVVFPDRTELADLNGDGRLDVIVSEENGLTAGAGTFWWEQPHDLADSDWVRHAIVSQGTTNSMDTADMDQDGDVDLILAEHRGADKLAIWMNLGDGTLLEQIVSLGKESHLGAQAVDLDHDGDLDLVSIAWDSYQSVHLWRNDALVAINEP